LKGVITRGRLLQWQRRTRKSSHETVSEWVARDHIRTRLDARTAEQHTVIMSAIAAAGLIPLKAAPVRRSAKATSSKVRARDVRPRSNAPSPSTVLSPGARRRRSARIASAGRRREDARAASHRALARRGIARRVPNAVENAPTRSRGVESGRAATTRGGSDPASRRA
jgi:hypothetical protein